MMVRQDVDALLVGGGRACDECPYPRHELDPVNHEVRGDDVEPMALERGRKHPRAVARTEARSAPDVPAARQHDHNGQAESLNIGVKANLGKLIAQKEDLDKKIAAFQKELKDRVLPTEATTKVDFQNKLKEAVAQVSAKAAAANVYTPKDFYLGFEKYQSQPPGDNATAALARELRALELVMVVLIKTSNIEVEEFHRDLLPEEGSAGGGKRRGASDSMMERATLKLKLTSKDDALRSVLTELANHKQQLFIIRNVAIQNKVMDSPARAIAPGPPGVPGPAPDASAPGTPPPAVPPTGAPIPAGTPPPAAPDPAAPGPPGAPEVGLAYVFGAEKITANIELEILNIEEPKAGSEKPDKGGKKKDK